MLGEHCYVTSLMTDVSLKGTCAVSGKLSNKVVFCQKTEETKCVAQMVEIYSVNSISTFKQLGSTGVVPSSGIVKPNFDIVIISEDEKFTATPFYKLFLNYCFLVIFLLLLCL